MWDTPYLESCCRSALHRLVLAAAAGRPPETRDARCLARLGTLGLARQQGDGRSFVTAEGLAWHNQEIGPAIPALSLKRPSPL